MEECLSCGLKIGRLHDCKSELMRRVKELEEETRWRKVSEKPGIPDGDFSSQQVVMLSKYGTFIAEYHSDGKWYEDGMEAEMDGDEEWKTF